MAIHHMHKKQAEKRGFLLEERGDRIRAFWPAHAVEVFADTSAAARDQMIIIQDNFDGEFEQPVNNAAVPNGPPPTHSEAGVPLNGADAHKAGFTAADCPYTSETEDDDEYAEFERWNAEFDDAADEATEEETHSVVDEKYRAIYAERGHPTHCGDDLATLLNNLCLTEKSGTDLERFEAICEANGVSLAKYNRTSNGWQGRLRMTGRNLLARKVWENDGVVLTPVEGADPQYQMSAEWMATRKFRKD